jgi:hypothetical protein
LLQFQSADIRQLQVEDKTGAGIRFLVFEVIGGRSKTDDFESRSPEESAERLPHAIVIIDEVRDGREFLASIIPAQGLGVT